MTQKNAAAQQRQALLTALGAQQRIMEAQDRWLASLQSDISMIAHYAGLSDKLQSTADINNPASPVADPAAEAATMTTEQALESAGHDNVENIGSTPGVNEGVAAEKTTTPMKIGDELPTQPFNDLIDVTAPISGTTEQLPRDQTRIETDVRVGDPDNTQVAFPWNGGNNGASDVNVTKRTSNRTFDSLKLAKLRMIAGVEAGEELEIAGRIEADASLSDDMIEHEINVLSAIKTNAAKATPRNLVPRTASAERSQPSLVAEGGLGRIVAGVSNSDTEDSDLFD